MGEVVARVAWCAVVVALAASLSIGPSRAQSVSQPAVAGALGDDAGPGAQRCEDVDLRDRRGLRLRPLLAALTRAGVRDAAESEPSHGLPFRSLWGEFAGQEMGATAVRPGSRLFRDRSRVVRSFDVRGTRVRERVQCSRPRTHSFVFVADGVHWALYRLGRDDAETLIARIAR